MARQVERPGRGSGPSRRQPGGGVAPDKEELEGRTDETNVDVLDAIRKNIIASLYVTARRASVTWSTTGPDGLRMSAVVREFRRYAKRLIMSGRCRMACVGGQR